MLQISRTWFTQSPGAVVVLLLTKSHKAFIILLLLTSSLHFSNLSHPPNAFFCFFFSFFGGGYIACEQTFIHLSTPLTVIHSETILLYVHMTVACHHMWIHSPIFTDVIREFREFFSWVLKKVFQICSSLMGFQKCQIMDNIGHFWQRKTHQV